MNSSRHSHFNIAVKLCFILLLILTFLVKGIQIHAQALDRSSADDEVDYHPGDNEVTATNPPAFNWLTVKEADSYIVQYSTTPSFTPAKTTTVRDIDMVVHVPTEILNPGTWYWRYGYSKNGSDQWSRTRRFEIPENAIHFPLVTADEFIERIPRHRPRLYFSPGLVEEVRSDTSGRYEKITRPVIEDAEQILAMNEPLFTEPEPYENFENPRAVYVATRTAFFPYSDRMLTCALAYLYSGDRRFAEEAKRRLMEFMTWDINGVSTAVRTDALAMSIAENGVAVFDWIYDILSEEERQLCKEILTARMVQINRGVHRSRPMESRPFASHQGRFIGFAIEGGIVLAHEAPEAREWIDYTLRLLWSTYPAWGGHEGGWHEGINYWTGYMRRMVRVVHELDHYGIPLKDKPFFRNTGYFGLYVGYPHRPTTAFGDVCHRPIRPATGQVSYMLANLYGNPYFRWHANEIGAEPTGREAIRVLNPVMKANPPVDMPISRYFEDVGIVAMHSNIAEPDNNVMMLFKSNPFGSISHNHASQNAFIIEAFKEPLAISSGYFQTYGNTHHREWIWQTKAHNSILVNGEGQVPRSRSSIGEIIEYKENDKYVYTAGDATKAYDGKLDMFHRHVLFVRPGYFVIIDDLKSSGSSSTFQWLLHTTNRMQVDDLNHVIVTSSGNARLTTKFLLPDNIRMTQHTGFEPPVKDPEIPAQAPGPAPDQFHLTVSTINPLPVTRFVTVLRVDRNKDIMTTSGEIPGSVFSETMITGQEDKSFVAILENEGIAEANLLERVVKGSEILEATGGIALRVENDLVLWKEPGAMRVSAAGTSSKKNMEVRPGFFKEY